MQLCSIVRVHGRAQRLVLPLALAFACSDTPRLSPDPFAPGGAGMPSTSAGTDAPLPPSTSGSGAAVTAGSSGSSSTPSPGAGSGAPAPNVDGGSADAGAALDGSTVAPTLRGTGPGDWVAGDYPPNLMEATYLEITGVAGQDGNTRQYKVHLPPSYDPNVPTPTVFCIHGLGQDPLLFCVTGAGMVAKSDAEGFALIMPLGFENSWNAGTCCGGASTAQLDEVALFRAILEEVGTHVNVDLDRVYALGLSNGGYMSYRLACEAADIFAAVAPGAGAIGKNDIGGGTNPSSNFTTCEPSQPVSVLDMHGTADGLVAYALQAPSLAHIAAENGCSSSTEPAAAPASAGDTTCVSHTGCPAGIEVTGCTVEGGGHCWFGSEDCGTGAGPIGLAIVGANSDTLVNTDAAWDFFVRHAR